MSAHEQRAGFLAIFFLFAQNLREIHASPQIQKACTQDYLITYTFRAKNLREVGPRCSYSYMRPLNHARQIFTANSKQKNIYLTV